MLNEEGPLPCRQTVVPNLCSLEWRGVRCGAWLPCESECLVEPKEECLVGILSRIVHMNKFVFFIESLETIALRAGFSNNTLTKISVAETRGKPRRGRRERKTPSTNKLHLDLEILTSGTHRNATCLHIFLYMQFICHFPEKTISLTGKKAQPENMNEKLNKNH